MITIHTIGHSRHPLDRFLALLQQHRIEALVDVRSAPYSRHAPQYRKRELQRALQARGLAYLHLGQQLGGMPPAPAAELQAGLARLVALAEQRRVVLMCAEEDPARCHRGALIAPALQGRGVEVLHIRGDGALQRADARCGAPGGQLRLFE